MEREPINTGFRCHQGNTCFPILYDARSSFRSSYLKSVTREVSPEEKEELFEQIKRRIEEDARRFPSLKWEALKQKLEENPEKVWSLKEMGRTGGCPRLVEYCEEEDTYIFCDCSKESPLERRYICYNKTGEDMAGNVGNFTPGNAVDMAERMGISVLTEEEYEKWGEFFGWDKDSSSWVQTPENKLRENLAFYGTNSKPEKEGVGTNSKTRKIEIKEANLAIPSVKRGFRGKLEV